MIWPRQTRKAEISPRTGLEGERALEQVEWLHEDEDILVCVRRWCVEGTDQRDQFGAHISPFSLLQFFFIGSSKSLKGHHRPLFLTALKMLSELFHLD